MEHHGWRGWIWRSGVIVALFVGLCAATTTPVQAQGRYEGTTEAEKLLREGREIEEEALSLKDNRPEDAASRYEDAVEVYTEAIRSDPAFTAAYVRLGYVYYALERNEKALDLLRPALERWPSDTELRRVYGTVLYGMQGRRQEAIGHLEQVHKAGDFFDVSFMLGKHYYEQSDWRRAAAAFRRYLVHKPDDVKIHGTLGNVYLKTGKYEPAMAEFRYVLSLEPGNIPAQINIGNILFRQKKYPASIDRFEKVLAQAPDQVGVHFNLASSYYQSSQWGAALTHYRAYAKHHPGHATTRYMSGLCLLEQGNRPQARQAFEQTLKIDGGYSKAYWRIGALEFGDKRYDAALGYLNKAHQRDPKHIWTLVTMGDVYRAKGDLTQAVQRHSQAVELGPKEPATHTALGRDLFAARQYDEARASFETAYGLSDRSPYQAELYAVALVHHGRALLGAGDLAQAAQAGTEVLRLPSGRALDGQLLLAAVAMARGDDAEVKRLIASVVRQAPNHPQVRHLQARVALAAGDAKAAFTALEPLAAKGQAPSAAVANDLGRACGGLGRWEEALTWFGQAKKMGMKEELIDGNFALALLRWGEELGEAGNWKGALEALQEADKLRGRLGVVGRLRLDLAAGVAYGEANNYGKALARLRAVTKALKALPKAERAKMPGLSDEQLNMRLAYVHYRLGQADKAIALLERRRFPPGQAQQNANKLLTSAYVRQASKMFQTGRLNNAEQLLRKAARTGRNDDALKHNQAVLDYARGRHAKAAAVFKAMSQQGTFSAALFNYAIYLDDIKRDKQGAFRHYSRYLGKGGGKRADIAKREVAIKKRVFGFSAGGP